MIRRVRLIKESEKAYFISFVSKNPKPMWIPKSVVTVIEHITNVSVPTNVSRIDIKDWFYNQKIKNKKRNTKKTKTVDELRKVEKIIPCDEFSQIYNWQRTMKRSSFTTKK